MATPVLSDKDHLNAARILNLPSPASDNEPARKGDLDAVIQGMAWKDNVRVSSTGNTDLNTPGATIDGVSMVSGDRVLLRSQTDEAENGLYVWTGASSPLTRAGDANDGAGLVNAIVSVDEGSSNAGTTWRQTQSDITLGVSDIIFEPFGASVPDATESVKGKVELSTQGEADAGASDDTVLTPLKAFSATWRGRGKVQQIGDGSGTQFEVAHNWGTWDVHVEVWQTTGNRAKVDCEISQPNNNTVRINTASVVASNALSVRIREVPTS